MGLKLKQILHHIQKLAGIEFLCSEFPPDNVRLILKEVGSPLEKVNSVGATMECIFHRFQ